MWNESRPPVLGISLCPSDYRLDEQLLTRVEVPNRHTEARVQQHREVRSLSQIPLSTQTITSIAHEALWREVELEIVVLFAESVNVLQLIDLSVGQLDLIELLLRIRWVQPAVG